MHIDAAFCFHDSPCVALFASFFYWTFSVILLSVIRAAFLPQILPLKNIPSDLSDLTKVLLLAAGSPLPKLVFSNKV